MPRIKKQHLKQRADKRYCCKYHGIQFMGWTEDEALQAREEYKRAEKAGELLGASVSVGEFAQRWMPIAHPSVSESTYSGLCIHMDKLTQAIGKFSVASITPLQIKEVYSTAYKGLSKSYIAAAKQLYCAMFDAAVSEGICRTNPARDKSAAPHKGTDGSHRDITAQEREWINTYCTDHRAHVVAIAMLYAGLRPQEAKALNIDESVDFENKIIHVCKTAHREGHNAYVITDQMKTKRSEREVPLFPPLANAIISRGKRKNEDQEEVYGMLLESANHKPLTVQAWWSAWESYVFAMETAINGCQKRWYRRTKAHKKILAEAEKLRKEGKVEEAKKKEAEIKPWVSFTVVPYDLRHAFVCWGRDNGVEINTMIRWMGHSDAKMILNIYEAFKLFPKTI
jgi:integrase